MPKSINHKPIHYITALWGDAYTDLFLDISLASQLADGNLSTAEDLHRNCYKIYSDASSKKRIQEHPFYPILQSRIETQFVDLAVPADLSEGKFDILNQIHRRAIKSAARHRAAMVFLAPDFVFAKHAFSRIREIHHSPHQVLFVLTPRLRMSRFIHLTAHRKGPDGLLNCSNRELADTALQCLHPIEKSYFWDNRQAQFPIHAYWDMGKQNGFVARCFYLHPIYVDPSDCNCYPEITIDADYIDRLIDDKNRIYVSQNSDDICCVELTDASRRDLNTVNRRPFALNLFNLFRWARVNANPVYYSNLHHWLFEQKIVFHNGDSPPLSGQRHKGDLIALGLGLLLKFEFSLRIARKNVTATGWATLRNIKWIKLKIRRLVHNRHRALKTRLARHHNWMAKTYLKISRDRSQSPHQRKTYRRGLGVKHLCTLLIGLRLMAFMEGVTLSLNKHNADKLRSSPKLVVLFEIRNLERFQAFRKTALSTPQVSDVCSLPRAGCLYAALFFNNGDGHHVRQILETIGRELNPPRISIIGGDQIVSILILRVYRKRMIFNP